MSRAVLLFKNYTRPLFKDPVCPMQATNILILILGLGAFAFFLGRGRSLALAKPLGGIRKLHSLPSYNGPLAGLVAVCAGSDVMHPIGSLVVGGIAGWLFVWLFTVMQNKIKVDDVLGVWPLHGVCGAWGAIAAGIFGTEALGGLGGVSLVSQLIGTALGIVIAIVGGIIVYGGVKKLAGLRLTEEEEYKGADLSIHRIGSMNSDDI